MYDVRACALASRQLSGSKLGQEQLLRLNLVGARVDFTRAVARLLMRAFSRRRKQPMVWRDSYIVRLKENSSSTGSTGNSSDITSRREIEMAAHAKT